MLQELSSMDNISQLQDEIQRLLTIMISSINYLTTRTGVNQISEDIPVTRQKKEDTYDSDEVFEANRKELVADLVVKAKQLELLIGSLPAPELEEAQVRRLHALEDEVTQANEEFVRALNRSKDLHRQIDETLRAMLDDTDVPMDSPG